MTRKRLNVITIIVILIYITAIIVGLILCDEKPDDYKTFIDLVPLIIAIPAAYLGFSFQKRYNYLQSLRQVWKNLVYSTQKAVLFTKLKSHNEKEWIETLLNLRISIEEVRSVYKNLSETDFEEGYYPFESLKKIFEIISDLKSDDIKIKDARFAEEAIEFHWKIVRKAFLSEFDRSAPSKFDSPFIDT